MKKYIVTTKLTCPAAAMQPQQATVSTVGVERELSVLNKKFDSAIDSFLIMLCVGFAALCGCVLVKR